MAGQGAGAEGKEEQIDPETPVTEVKLRQLLQIPGAQQGTEATWGGMGGAGAGFEDPAIDFMEGRDDEGWAMDEDMGNFTE